MMNRNLLWSSADTIQVMASVRAGWICSSAGGMVLVGSSASQVSGWFTS